MDIDVSSPVDRRVRVHAALGEPHRLRIVDALRLSDRTPSELRSLTGLDSNLLAFHLDVLEDAGLIARRRSEGDGRRRYVTLRWERLEGVDPEVGLPDGPVVFVCSRNAARSQIAAALWRSRTATAQVTSAGLQPAEAIDQLACEVAAGHGVDLQGRPRGYRDVGLTPAVVVSVCDRARESGVPWSAPCLHWSVPDPAGGDRADYKRAYRDIRRRVDRLSRAAGRAA